MERYGFDDLEVIIRDYPESRQIMDPCPPARGTLPEIRRGPMLNASVPVLLLCRRLPLSTTSRPLVVR